jgi:hypothetical protein
MVKDDMGIGGHAADQWHEPIVSDGEERAAAQPNASDWVMSDDQAGEAPRPPKVSFTRRLPALFIALISLAWVGAVGWKVATDGPRIDPQFAQIIVIAAIAAAPVMLITIAWLLVAPRHRRERRQYAEVTRAIRSDSLRLEEVMFALAQTMEANRSALENQISLLEHRGAEANAKMAEIISASHENVTAIARHSMILGASATSAREEMTQLMNDIPQAEKRLATLASMMAGVGDALSTRADGLQTQLAAIASHARDADLTAGSAAERLATQLSRIESSSAGAAEQLETATASMSESVETVLDQASKAVDASRRGMDVQGSAMIAMIEQGRAALDRAGIESTQSLARRIDEIGDKVDRITEKLAAQGDIGLTVVNQLDIGLKEAESRFAQLNELGTEKTADLAEAIVALTDHAGSLTQVLGESSTMADKILERAEALRTAIENSVREMNAGLPLTLAQVEEQLLHSQTTIRALLPDAQRLESAASTAAEKVADAGFAIADHGKALDSLSDVAAQQFSQVRSEAEELRHLIAEANEGIQHLTGGSTAQLVEALQRVREAAAQATQRARETLGAVIPEAAQKLSDASAQAMQQAISKPLDDQLAGMTQAVERAVDAAYNASNRLTHQMATISETTAAIEDRISEAKAEVERNDADNFSRRVALLIEALNSTAIDVTKILSNEVTDAAWAAYLRGDRGVFTRRAVKLLDAGEVRDICRHYEDDPEFRGQVNRYIHDFEAMLRRVLATRDGNPLGVTLLSSDMGKLYVALAQAIERLRA